MRNVWGRCLAAVAVAVLAACGGSNHDSLPEERSQIAGAVLDGRIANALVCMDVNTNGRCDANEPYSRSDDRGQFLLTFPKGTDGPLLAIVTAGEARDDDRPGAPVDASYVMTSPSGAYSSDITPFTTLVRLTQEADYRLAEDRVRNLVGLPPRFDIRNHAAASPGTYGAAVRTSIVEALKSLGSAFDTSSKGAWSDFVKAMPARLIAFPVLRIATEDAAPIVSKEDYLDATFTLIVPVISDEPVALNGKIRGRGQSTWGQPKNPYKVQFKNDEAYAALSDFLGMPKNRNWALLADYFDRTLMRNKIALSLGSSSVFSDGLKWTPSGQHIEVYLNGDYVGVYLLTEDIRIAPERLNIRGMSSDPAKGEVDGGFIVEADVRLDCYKDDVLNLQLVTPKGALICIDTPDEEDITAEQLAYIKKYLLAVEQDLYSADQLAKIDLISFVDFYLLSELFRNIDSDFYSSVFLFKDSAAAADPADRLLNAGPLWDFDRSAGNTNNENGWLAEGCWTNTRTDTRRPSPLPNWFAELSRYPAFVDMVIERWKAKRPAIETYINTSIDTFAFRLDGPQQRNFERWQILGVPMTGFYTFPTHEEEVQFLRTFLNDRMLWLDKVYASRDTFNQSCR